MYHYAIAGLFLDSEMIIPRMPLLEPRGDAVPDIVVRFSDDPDLGGRWEADFRALSPDRSNLCVEPQPGLRYRVIGGRRVEIHRGGDFSDADVYGYFAGTVWGVLFHQRGLLPLHCSAILDQGRAICFTGLSGAGKSTLALGLANRGYDHLSDDLIVVDRSDDRPIARATTSRIKLCEDAIGHFGLAGDGRANSRFYAPKFYVDQDGGISQSDGPMGAIYLLDYAENGDVTAIEKVQGHAAWSALYRSVFRINMSPWINSHRAIAEYISWLASEVPVFRFTRPRQLDLYADGLDLLERHIAANRTASPVPMPA